MLGKAAACRATAGNAQEVPMKKALTLALLWTALALLLLPAVAQATTQPTAAEKRVVSLINGERAEFGLAPVHFAVSLTRAARAHLRELSRRDVLTHRSANGASVSQRLIRHGYRRSGFRFWMAGENVARARSESPTATPEGIVFLWMSSGQHRQVILEREFRDVGVGMGTSSGGMLYATLDMGRRVR
jgi:uncharacterized protein YkwD